MTKRERRYHYRRLFKKLVGKMPRLDYRGMLDYGVLGIEHYLDNDGIVKSRQLTTDECFYHLYAEKIRHQS